MNLGIFLGIGESLDQMEKAGQKNRFINLYLKKYAKEFNYVYLFSYNNESSDLPKNVILVPNRSRLHRYLYALLLPIIHNKEITNCNVVRGFGLSSAVSSFLLTKPFVFNWAYDYIKFLKIDNKYLLIPVFKLLELFAFLRANKIFVATKQKLKTLKNPKFIYLPNGVDLKAFNLKSAGKGPVFVGRFEKQKNLFFLIDAIAKLPVLYRVITFIGQGSQKSLLIKYAAIQKVSLKILPPVKNIDLPKLLSKFSILTMTSLAEGSPKVLLEAMAIGLVPVVTDFSTAREIIDDGENGYITKYDTVEYSKLLESLLSYSIAVNKMSQNAKQTIANNFNLEKLLNQEINILKEVAR